MAEYKTPTYGDEKALDAYYSGDDVERVPAGVSGRRASINDEVFGEITDIGPNYRDVRSLHPMPFCDSADIFPLQVGWLGTAVLMMKTQIGLGVLAIPAVFDSLGLIPGVISLIVIGFITSWSDYEVGVFKRNHPEVYSIDDVGRLLFGRIGCEVFAVSFVLCEYS